MRTAEIIRKTAETDIALKLELDGSGVSEIATGCGFLDHMLTLLAKHGLFDLTVKAKGDTNVDYHHTVEDVGICLGLAFKEALGNKAGIVRYGDTTLPMDEALILTAIDLSGRGFFVQDINISANKVGDFDTELVSARIGFPCLTTKHFINSIMRAFCRMINVLITRNGGDPAFFAFLYGISSIDICLICSTVLPNYSHIISSLSYRFAV